jgi:hypothetical protein
VPGVVTVEVDPNGNPPVDVVVGDVPVVGSILP